MECYHFNDSYFETRTFLKFTDHKFTLFPDDHEFHATEHLTEKMGVVVEERRQ